MSDDQAEQHHAADDDQRRPPLPARKRFAFEPERTQRQRSAEQNEQNAEDARESVKGALTQPGPGPGGIISGCYVKTGGVLSVIDSAQKCASNQTCVNWNQNGPLPGHRGRLGAQGPPGGTAFRKFEVLSARLVAGQL